MDYQRAENELKNVNQENAEGGPPLYSGIYPSTNVEHQQPTMITINSPNAAPPGMPIMPQPVGPKSALMTCPHCRCRIQSRISHKATSKTHIACLLLSWTCCCCCLPYCMDSCRNTNHFCPMCGAFLGTYVS